MPVARAAQFALDIRRARDLVALGQSLGSMTYGLVDASDFFRYGLVQAVAAMDHYFHGVVLDRGVDILLGRAVSGGAAKLGIPFHAVADILTAVSPAESELRARSHLAQRLSSETFQRPDAIGAALSMVGVAKVWTVGYPGKGMASRATIVLGVVVQRRNRIVHQADADPLTPRTITPLSAQDAVDAIGVVEQTVKTLDSHC